MLSPACMARVSAKSSVITTGESVRASVCPWKAKAVQAKLTCVLDTTVLTTGAAIVIEAVEGIGTVVPREVVA